MYFFFCDATSQVKRSSIAILRSLVAQSVVDQPMLVEKAFEWMVKSGQKRATSFNALVRLFRELLVSGDQTPFLIIDAIDECEEGSLLLQELHEIRSVENKPLHVLVFSRNEPWIYRKIESWSKLSILPHLIHQDVTLYIDRSLQKPPLSMIQEPELKSRIIAVLTSGANGQFLWVKLMIQALQKATFISEIGKILDDLPRGLGQAYGRVLERLLLEGVKRQEAGHMLFKWLVCAERPLGLKELGTALAFRHGAAKIDASDRVVDLASFVEELCGSLVKISDRYRGDEAATVSFVHLTVKEYLVSSEELREQKSLAISRFHVECSEGNRHLAFVCLGYLNSGISSACGLQRGNWGISAFPFRNYASSYWATHLAHSGPPNPELLRLLKAFLESEQLHTYLESSLDSSGTPTSSLLQNQGHLNTWIRQCDAKDPRLASILDYFRNRFEQIYKQRGATLGLNHADTLEAGYQFAQLLHFRGEWVQSKTLHQQTLEGRLSSVGAEDKRSLQSMYQLGRLLTHLGEYNEARKLQEQSLAGMRSLLGLDAPDTLLAEDAFAQTLKEQGHLDDAESLSRMTLARKIHVFGDDSLEATWTMDYLASILKDVGLARKKDHNDIMAKEAFWECEQLSRNCLMIRQERVGANNPETCTTINMLGLVLRHLGRYEESEKYHRQSLRIRTEIFGQHNPHTQRSTRNLICALKDQHKKAEAAELEGVLEQSLLIDTTLKVREEMVLSNVPAAL